ncbi:PPOX class F420-dependent oxidoreductase [Phycicoccus sp. Root101]|uniref:PPOX class F420-dependent oxidoreductase n=1 Tax=Phycicoccus sp. Root101 TaxID=1736421 RepID=UPI000702D60A|nr:PPOX class F420-dependent oxidoreductase [Phycicoccus sp. Root101]KQU69490.1 pyridoxamine 5-phosphate oxidase [Phycicoccus sp. Root101]
MTTAPTLDALGEEKFVSLTTFRKTGVGVSTPVWIGREGDALVVTTPSGSGKVKRLRNNTRVELQPCSRRGTVEDGAPTVAAVAEIVQGPEAMRRLDTVLRPKYGIEYRIVMTIEKIMRRGHTDRTMLRITSA